MYKILERRKKKVERLELGFKENSNMIYYGEKKDFKDDDEVEKEMN